MELLTQMKSHYRNGFTNIDLLRDWIGQVYVVSNDIDRYILKLFRKEHTMNAIQSVEVMTYLKNNDFPVPRIIPTLDSKLHFEYNNQVAVLYEYIDGEDVTKANNLFTIGRQSGWMRKLMASYTGEVINHEYCFFINRYLKILKRKEYPRINKFAELGTQLWDKVKDLPLGFIHGDLHVGNMFQRKNEIVFYDFDACAITSPVYDIATVCDATDYFDLSDYNFEEGFIQTKRNITEFLKGYEAHFHLNKEEEQAIYIFIAIRHFDIQATIIESQGLACVDEHFLDNQYIWLKKWLERL